MERKRYNLTKEQEEEYFNALKKVVGIISPLKQTSKKIRKEMGSLLDFLNKMTDRKNPIEKEIPLPIFMLSWKEINTEIEAFIFGIEIFSNEFYSVGIKEIINEHGDDEILDAIINNTLQVFSEYGASITDLYYIAQEHFIKSKVWNKQTTTIKKASLFLIAGTIILTHPEIIEKLKELDEKQEESNPVNKIKEVLSTSMSGSIGDTTKEGVIPILSHKIDLNKNFNFKGKDEMQSMIIFLKAKENNFQLKVVPEDILEHLKTKEDYFLFSFLCHCMNLTKYIDIIEPYFETGSYSILQLYKDDIFNAMKIRDSMRSSINQIFDCLKTIKIKQPEDTNLLYLTFGRIIYEFVR